MEDQDKKTAADQTGSDNGMFQLSFTFKINMHEYAKRFGIEIPDDSMDVELTGSHDKNESKTSYANDEAPLQAVASSDVQDADVSYGQRMQQYDPANNPKLTCKTTLAQCQAKNPMTCRYHGAQAIAMDIEAQLRSQGVNGKVTCELLAIQGNMLSANATVVSPVKEKKQVEAALAQFFKLPGVKGDIADLDKDGKIWQNMFEVDMLDPNAKARWVAGASSSATTASATPSVPSPQVAPSQVPVTPAPTGTPPAPAATTAPTPPPAPKPRPTRMRRASINSPVIEQQPAPEPIATKTDDKAESAQGPMDVAFDPSAPELYPEHSPDAPPPFTPDFTDLELDFLENASTRIAKTIRQINNHADKGTTEAWLNNAQKNGVKMDANGNPVVDADGNQVSDIPKSLRQYYDEASRQKLESYLPKDTHGFVQKLLDALDLVDASAQNGWKDHVLPEKWDPNKASSLYKQKPGRSPKMGDIDFSDYAFDRKAYEDPYAEKRKEMAEFVPSSSRRKSDMESLEKVFSSALDTAPKKEAEAAKDAASRLTELEGAFGELNAALSSADDASKDVFQQALKMCAQSYYQADQDYTKAFDVCKKWLAKQFTMQPTIAGTIENLKSEGRIVPEELGKWQDVEDQYEDGAARSVFQRLGLAIRDKVQHMKRFKNNMRALATKCPLLSCYDIAHIRSQVINGDHIMHANTNSYVDGANAAFGTTWARHSSAAKKGMHLYGVFRPEPFLEISNYYSRASNTVKIVYNPKKAIFSFTNKFCNSASAITPHNQSCNATFMYDATCTGVSFSSGSCSSSYKGVIKEAAFTEDLTQRSMRSIWGMMFSPGSDDQIGEGWCVGGGNAKEGNFLAMQETPYAQQFSDAEVKKLNKFGITVFDAAGKIKGQNVIPDDPDLIELIYGTREKPKS